MVTVDPETATPSPETVADEPDSFTVDALLSSYEVSESSSEN